MKRYILIACVLIGTAPGLIAQKPAEALSLLANEYPSEKIYIHYDKDYYTTGETIWFKAYLYNRGLPSSLSNNFYIQLIGPDGKMISQKKYPIKGATATGDFALADSLPQGYYHIRALTPAMLNANRDFLYSKNIFIFSTSVGDLSVVESKPRQAPPLSISFFPESGKLVGDVISVLVFKATDSLGQPANTAGTIRTDDGTVITGFKTATNGMGKVQFKAQADKKYVAAVEVNGQTVFFPLPQVVSSGINLRVENEKGGKVFMLSRSKKDKDRYAKIWLLAEMNNMIVYENEIDFESYFSVKGHLLTDSLPSGILHFTAFDMDGKPLAERLTFVDNGEYDAKASIQVIKQGTGKREENIFEIAFPDLAQRSFSVSVVDEEFPTATKKETIISSLLLTDDLRGGIEQPAWYFEDRQDSVRQAAFDQMLLTRDWQRFSWDKVLANDFPKKEYQDQYLIRINGSLKVTKTNTPVSGGNLTVFLEAMDSTNQSFEIPVTPDGGFTIDSLLFFGRAKIFYAYKTEQGREKTVNITLKPVPLDMMVANLPYVEETEELQTDNKWILAKINKKPASTSSLASTKELNPVVVESKSSKRPIDIVNEKYTSSVFSAMGKVNIDLVNNPENNRALSAFDYVKREVRHIMEKDGKFVSTKNFSIFNASTDAWYNQQQRTLDSTAEAAGGSAPGSSRFIDKGIREKGNYFAVDVYVNESMVDAQFLKTIRIDNIALVKFFEPGFLGSGMNGPGGTVAVYTKNEIVIDQKLEKLDHANFDGYSVVNKFDSPDYSQPSPRHQFDDNRTTLYWNPDMITGADSKNVRFRFYNNDISKRFRIVIEGFDANGRLIHVEKMIPE